VYENTTEIKILNIIGIGYFEIGYKNCKLTLDKELIHQNKKTI